MMTIFHCCNTHSEPWHHFLNQMTGEIPIFSIKTPGELPLFNVGSATEDSLAAATVATFASLQTAARRGLHRSSPCPSSISPTKEWVQHTYINYPYKLCEPWCIMYIIYIMYNISIIISIITHIYIYMYIYMYVYIDENNNACKHVYMHI